MESGLCTARRGVGLFVRSLPNRKLSLLVSSTKEHPGDDFLGQVEKRIAERCQADGIEIERFHITPQDPPYGPDVDRIRRPGRLLLCLGLSHEPHLKQLADLRRPMLVVGCAPNRSNASSIVANSFRAGYLAGRYLVKKGCRRIAFIGRQREVRGVNLPEAESLKELAGMQCACMEDGLRIHPELIFSDLSQVSARMGQGTEPADGVVMPDAEGVEVIQALKAIGPKAERVAIGDDRILERARRPTAVVVKREDVVELVLSEMNRLLDEQTKSYRSLVVDCELHEAPSA
jgi:DNA-binding LacI/PurR family transcriptional regulator